MSLANETLSKEIVFPDPEAGKYQYNKTLAGRPGVGAYFTRQQTDDDAKQDGLNEELVVPVSESVFDAWEEGAEKATYFAMDQIIESGRMPNTDDPDNDPIVQGGNALVNEALDRVAPRYTAQTANLN